MLEVFGERGRQELSLYDLCADCVPVLAVGSNASPAQLVRKFKKCRVANVPLPVNACPCRLCCTSYRITHISNIGSHIPRIGSHTCLTERLLRALCFSGSLSVVKRLCVWNKTDMLIGYVNTFLVLVGIVLHCYANIMALSFLIPFSRSLANSSTR